MSEKEGSAVSLVVETKPELPSFLSDKLDLKKLAREIAKVSSKAVDVLVKLLDSQDERVRLEAAKKLVEFQVQVAKEISADQMARLIAEIRLVRAPAKKLVEIQAEEESKPRPLVDFSTIRQFS